MLRDEQTMFDRELTFDEVFRHKECSRLMEWLRELLEQDVMLIGRKGESILFPPNSESLKELPHPAERTLPEKTMHYHGATGVSSLGIPISYEAETFALLIVSDRLLEDNQPGKKIGLAARIIEWYITQIHQKRMISELHDHTEEINYQELLAKHKRVVESEQKYRKLSETLEQRVEERKRELEKAHQRLLQQDKMASIGQLAAGVAHEINNPAGFIRSNLDTLASYQEDLVEALKIAQKLLEEHNVPDRDLFMEKCKECDLDFILNDLPVLVKQSLEGTERITKIVKGLSRFSHVDEEVTEDLDINELLESTVDLLSNEIKHKAELVKVFGDIPVIKGNPNQLSQVFVNLIVNALQAMTQKGILTIATISDSAGIEIEISDTGVGIGPENLSNIFNPFFTTKPVGQGTGLGLSISYEIIKAHGGDIRVESKPWEGTTFHITLPIKNEEREKRDESETI